MPASHGRQKQLAKQKKKRALAHQAPRSPALAALASTRALIAEASKCPHGPSFISTSWRQADLALPELVTVIVTRELPGGVFLPGVALVDRTCLGIKNGYAAGPGSEAEVLREVRRIGEAHPEGIEPCELLVAQSVVFHAIDFARRLGFEPHRDFPAALFGPRPAKLLDTPLAQPPEPVYVPGPDDDVARVLAQLERARPAGDFQVPLLPLEAVDELDWDDE